jgi:hypothetical protein
MLKDRTNVRINSCLHSLHAILYGELASMLFVNCVKSTVCEQQGPCVVVACQPTSRGECGGSQVLSRCALALRYGLRGFYERDDKPVTLTNRMVDGIHLKASRFSAGGHLMHPHRHYSCVVARDCGAFGGPFPPGAMWATLCVPVSMGISFQGGTCLGTSRGGAKVSEIVKRIDLWGLQVSKDRIYCAAWSGPDVLALQQGRSPAVLCHGLLTSSAVALWSCLRLWLIVK